MIREHEFNTSWWGRPVGIVDGVDFFSRDVEEIEHDLAPFDWVEFKAELNSDLPLNTITGAGFFQADTQLPFLINLKQVAQTPSTRELSISSADEDSFNVTAESLANFAHERFRYLSGCDVRRINERYALWANALVEQSPRDCLRVSLNGTVQGWYLAQPAKSHRLQLTLAMLSSEATISGMLLYQGACAEYAQRGYRLGEASFSVTNTAVHNMYAGLDARFLAPIGHWLWISGNRG